MAAGGPAVPVVDDRPDVSVVLPCYNERDHVELEVKRIRAALDAAGMRHEVICVDDGSTDGAYRLLRVPAKWAIRKLAAYLTSTDIPDLNSGLRAFKRSVAQPYLRPPPPGFSCVTTITLAFWSNGHGVKYVPIDYFKRAGRSKFHPFKDAYNYIIQVLRMVMYFNPLRVLMPVALTLLAATFIKAGIDLVVHDLRVAGSTVLVGLAAFNIMAIALLADLVVRRTATD